MKKKKKKVQQQQSYNVKDEISAFMERYLSQNKTKKLSNFAIHLHYAVDEFTRQ